MHEAVWVEEPFINRVSTQVGLAYEIDLHYHSTSVDWVVWGSLGQVLADGLVDTVAEAKAAAWLAIGADLGYLPREDTATKEAS